MFLCVSGDCGILFAEQEVKMKRNLAIIVSFACIGGLFAAPTVSREETAKTWRLLARDISMWNKPRPCGTETVPNYQPPESEVLNRQALIWPEDRDPLDVLLRRTQALADDLQSSPDAQTVFAQDRAELSALAAQAAKTPPADEDARYAIFMRLMRLRKAIAWKNPLVRSIRKLLFVTREAFPTQELDWGTHICDQFFGFHARLKESTSPCGQSVPLQDTTGRTRSPVPPTESPTAASAASNGSIIATGTPGTSIDRREVSVTKPFPNRCAAAATACICSAVTLPFTVTTRAEKVSVPLLRSHPRPFNALISSAVIAVVLLFWFSRLRRLLCVRRRPRLE